MYEQFGASLDQDRVTFRLFLPDNQVDPTQYERGGSPRIRRVRVIGNFQHHLGQTDWTIDSAPSMEVQAHPKGWLYRLDLPKALPEGFYQYKYFVTFENGTSRYCSDPCSKYGGSDEHENAAFVVGGRRVQAQPIAKRLHPRDWITYELMIDDFTAEYRGASAPVDAVLEKLPHLLGLGVNAVEFMPWIAWPGGSFSWGYDPFQFFSVEYRYVNDAQAPADKIFKLMTLINRLHERDLHVIMDGVFNHVRAGRDPNHGFPYLWLYENPDDSPYIGSFGLGGFFEELDYDNGCVQEFIRDVCLFWLDRYQIDGIRFDFTRGFYHPENPSRGITKLISDVRGHLAAAGKENVGLLLEHLTDNRFDAIHDTNQIGASGCWFDPLMYQSMDAARSGHIGSEILRVLNANLDFAPGKVPVTYAQNHDHSTIVQAAGGSQRWFKTQPAAIALLTSPGSVMLHNGQEFGEDYFLPNEGADRVQPRPLRWSKRGPGSGDFAGERLSELYQQLIRIRKDHPALRSSNFFPYPLNHPDGYGVFTDKDVVIFHRWGDADEALERFIVAINYSDFDQWIDIPFSANGEWQELLEGGSRMVNDFRIREERIPSNWGRIFYRRD